jgi:hypothetical protein
VLAQLTNQMKTLPLRHFVITEPVHMHTILNVLHTPTYQHTTYNIQQEILSHYIGSLLWPILSLLSTVIPIFCKAGSTHFSWIYCSQCKVLFTTFKESDGIAFLWLAHMSHLQNMLFIANWSSGETSDRHCHLPSVQGLLLHPVSYNKHRK